MIKINKTVYGYYPEFDEDNHKIQVIFSRNSFGETHAHIVDRFSCDNMYDCQCLREHNGQCPLMKEHIDDIEYF